MATTALTSCVVRNSHRRQVDSARMCLRHIVKDNQFRSALGVIDDIVQAAGNSANVFGIERGYKVRFNLPIT